MNQIHQHPELAYHEYKAHALLTDFLEKKGLKVTRSAYGLETAFVAEYGPVADPDNGVFTVGFLSEMDALPEIGHACGHNLIAIVGIGAALAFKAVIDHANLKCRLVLFGTPAEEKIGGKIDMIKAGAFKNVDIALMAHPGNINCAYAHYLALQQLNIEYFGRAAHASAAPFDGVNALDAVITAYNSISVLRCVFTPCSFDSFDSFIHECKTDSRCIQPVESMASSPRAAMHQTSFRHTPVLSIL